MDLEPTRGREQAGRRPVLVVSSDAINRQPLVVTVVVGTTGDHLARDYPTNVRVREGEGGLERETVFLCFQVGSLDPGRLEHRAGMLGPERMAEVQQALRLSLGL